MTVIFGLSAMMLVPKFRTVFKAPVPSIHNTIGISLIPWGVSYLVYLPDFYVSLNNIAWREYAYTVVSLFTTIMCLSATAWAFVSVFQQGVRQRVIQPSFSSSPSLSWRGIPSHPRNGCLRHSSLSASLRS